MARRWTKSLQTRFDRSDLRLLIIHRYVVCISADDLNLAIKGDNDRIDTLEVQHATIILNYDDDAKLLGFRHGTTIEEGNSLTSEFVATPNAGFNQMYL